MAAAQVFAFGSAFAGQLAGGQHAERVLLFSGFDLWRNGGFAYGGLLWSPKGLSSEGFTLKLLVGGGRYRYLAGTTPITGNQALTSVMAGWRFKRGASELTLFAGPDLQSTWLHPDDPGNRMRGVRGGVRLGADLWYQPSSTFMANASISASSIGPSYWVRGAVGWRVWKRLWFGPELLALGDDHYRQFRAGVHVTAFRTKLLEWSAGCGYAYDSDHRGGLYTHLGVILRR